MTLESKPCTNQMNHNVFDIKSDERMRERKCAEQSINPICLCERVQKSLAVEL